MASQKYNYFNALIEMTEFACQAAEFFQATVKSFNKDTIQDKMKEIHAIEHRADEKRHEIMSHLAAEFLPPIEREDIAELAMKIDDIVDSIDDVLAHLYIYDVDALLPECIKFSDVILLCCESIHNIAIEFEHFRKSSTIHDHIIATNQLENQGDSLYAEAMRWIFTSDLSVKEIFIWARIITSFEECCDHSEDAAELFESAMMKNS